VKTLSNPWVLSALTILGFAACATIIGARKPRSIGDEIRYTHQKHADVPCETCHVDATTTRSLGTSMLPKEETCLICHADQKEAKNCGYCHRNSDTPRSYAVGSIALKFPHGGHAKVEGGCVRCHSKLVEMDGVRHQPTMALCTNCHNHKEYFDEGLCDKCHVDLKALQVKPETAFSHQAGFLKSHAFQGRSSSQTCATCHDQTFCADCHARTVAIPIELKWSEDPAREFIHRADYRSRHSFDARANAASCQKCHGSSFCSSCHQGQAFTLRGNLIGGINNGAGPHNPNEIQNPAAPGFHGRLVRQNAAACASCHDKGQQSICISCHSGSTAPNPHPSNYRNTHNRADINKNPMCKYCHTEG
jgi:hypothetical protein